MKNLLRFLAILTVCLMLAYNTAAQDCPSGQVCVPQTRFNEMIGRLNELVEARTTIAALLKERGASDATIASAVKTIEGWKNLDEINNTIILKQRDVIALYEKTIQMYAGLVEQMEKRLNKPKSAWSRFVSILKNAAILLAGIQLGRGI